MIDSLCDIHFWKNELVLNFFETFVFLTTYFCIWDPCLKIFSNENCTLKCLEYFWLRENVRFEPSFPPQFYKFCIQNTLILPFLCFTQKLCNMTSYSREYIWVHISCSNSSNYNFWQFFFEEEENYSRLVGLHSNFLDAILQNNLIANLHFTLPFSKSHLWLIFQINTKRIQ